MNKKYSEQINRYPAVTDEGKSCEILERITFEREVRADGSLGEPVEINRRFDLKTGERVNRLSDGEFEDDVSGTRLRLRDAAP